MRPIGAGVLPGSTRECPYLRLFGVPIPLKHFAGSAAGRKGRRPDPRCLVHPALCGACAGEARGALVDSTARASCSSPLSFIGTFAIQTWYQNAPERHYSDGNRSGVAGLDNITRGRKGTDMKTSEDVREGGLYASECCGEEVIVAEGATFTRCPKCERRCEWEMVVIVAAYDERENCEKEAA